MAQPADYQKGALVFRLSMVPEAQHSDCEGSSNRAEMTGNLRSLYLIALLCSCIYML